MSEPTTSRSADLPAQPVLMATNIVRAYGEQTVLRGVDFHAAPGEVVALTGPSGSGKTTLLHVLAGITRPDAGEVTYHGPDGDVVVSAAAEEARALLRRSAFGMVFQSGQLLGELTAVENVSLPLLLNGVAADVARGAADALFEPLGLGGLQERRPGELSGGQQQRVAIARALAPRPTVLFADEPTGALDRRTGDQVMDLLLRTQQTYGLTLIVVTHDPDIAARCDRVVTLRDGVAA